MKVYFSKILFVVVFSMTLVANGAYAGSRFAVIGEQLDYLVPQGWKLARMEGTPDSAFNVEYVPSGEDIQSWRNGYLLVRRIPYPAADVMEQMKLEKIRLNELALTQHMKEARSSCGGKDYPMTSRINTFNGIPFAVSGGFCDRYGAAAPYGEGAFVAFAEGKNYFFQVQYGWRPANEQAAATNLPWRIAPAKAGQYLNSLKTMTLCGGQRQAPCKIDYLAQE